MCITGLKKTVQTPSPDCHVLEMDELYWFIGKKPRTKTRENTYIMTMVSRLPRQIVGFDVAFDKSPERIQAIVDNAPESENYCTDGWTGYIDVIYPGRHIRNVSNKNDTFTVEGVNADLRHYIPILARRSRCFPRKLETLRAVLEVFIEAYNKFGVAKMKFRQNRNPISRELPFSVLDFL
jgi:IS1 family transposase